MLKFESLDVEKHRTELDKYYNHSNTPTPNRSDTLLKIHLYDGLNGACFIGINESREIVALISCHSMYLGDQEVLKLCHRFHIRSDYSNHLNYIYEENLERLLYEWISKVGLEYLPIFMNINEGNERALYGLSRIHFLKKNHYHHFNDYGKRVVKTKHIWLPYLVKEQGVWQYASWTTLDGIPWNPDWKPEKKEIAPEIVAKMNRRFPRDEEYGGWYYVVED
jgi:hypothetical protein